MLPCQVIDLNNLEKKHLSIGVCGKILLQINAKIGNTLWSVTSKP